MTEKPVAFLSYVRTDDQADDGSIIRFAERLSREVHVQLGQPFPIFTDQNSIEWGENWRDSVERSISAAALLIAIVTPSLFNSEMCRTELEKFLARERALSRDDLILPVYYVTCRQDDEDELKHALFQRQYVDWRELRFESFNSPEVRRAFGRLATAIGSALERPLQTPSVPESVLELPAADEGDLEEPAGFIDNLITFEDEANKLTSIVLRLNDAVTSLGSSISDRAEELNRLQAAEQRLKLRLYKKSTDKAAEDMLQFVGRIDEDLPLFSSASKKAFGAYRQAALIASQFGGDQAGIPGAYETVGSLERSIAESGKSLAELASVIAGLPPISTAFSRAKTRAVDAMARLSTEWNNARQLASEVQADLLALLPSQSLTEISVPFASGQDDLNLS